jgi:hypothetical protein
MLSHRTFILIIPVFILISICSCKKHQDNQADLPYKDYDGYVDGFRNSIISSADNKLYIVGRDLNHELLILKTDLDGNLIWEKTFEFFEDEQGHQIIETSDGGLLIASGAGPYYKSNFPAYLIKINFDGDSLWTYRITENSSYEFSCVVELKDHNFVVAGFKRLNSYPSELLLSFVKIDQNGRYLMTRTYEDTLSRSNIIQDYKLEENGNILFCGNDYEPGNFIIEIDPSLEILSEMRFNVSNLVFLFGHNPEEMLAIDDYPISSIAILYKLDNENNIIAEATYKFPLLSHVEMTGAEWMKPVPEGTFVLGNLVKAGHDQYDFFTSLALVDENGNQKWLWYEESHTWGIQNVHYLSDGNYILILNGSGGITICPVKNYIIPIR